MRPDPELKTDVIAELGWDPAINATAIEPARVKVTLKSGRVVEASSDVIKGSPEQPMTGQEASAKLRACLEFGLGASAAQADRLADTLANLENVEDAGRAIVDVFPS